MGLFRSEGKRFLYSWHLEIGLGCGRKGNRRGFRRETAHEGAFEETMTKISRRQYPNTVVTCRLIAG